MRVALAVLLLSGCGAQTREARATLPLPSSADDAVGGKSQTLEIEARDYLLPEFCRLRSYGRYEVATADRLVFHVGLARADERDARTSGWQVRLETDGGSWAPSARSQARLNRVALNLRFAQRANPSEEGKCIERLLPGYTAYLGQAEYAFEQPALAGSQRLTLVLERDGVQLRFTWRAGDPPSIEHYGRRELEASILVPGPCTEIAATLPD